MAWLRGLNRMFMLLIVIIWNWVYCTYLIKLGQVSTEDTISQKWRSYVDKFYNFGRVSYFKATRAFLSTL